MIIPLLAIMMAMARPISPFGGQAKACGTRFPAAIPQTTPLFPGENATSVPGDYDNDGKDDIAVWRPDSGTWFALLSGTPGDYTSTAWGMDSDVPAPGDYDGDGKTDLAVWRPGSGTWFVLESGNPGSYISMQWGIGTDIPTPGDYDADGRTDIAVWRPTEGVWYIITAPRPEAIQQHNGAQAGYADLPHSQASCVPCRKPIWSAQTNLLRSLRAPWITHPSVQDRVMGKRLISVHPHCWSLKPPEALGSVYRSVLRAPDGDICLPCRHNPLEPECRSFPHCALVWCGAWLGSMNHAGIKSQTAISVMRHRHSPEPDVEGSP
jgi:hypothetical protein